MKCELCHFEREAVGIYSVIKSLLTSVLKLRSVFSLLLKRRNLHLSHVQSALCRPASDQMLQPLMGTTFIFIALCSVLTHQIYI